MDALQEYVIVSFSKLCFRIYQNIIEQKCNVL